MFVNMIWWYPCTLISYMEELSSRAFCYPHLAMKPKNWNTIIKINIGILKLYAGKEHNHIHI